MKEKESISTKELAEAFDMKVTEFARLTGYSRQALHQILSKVNGVCSGRMLATINHLQVHSKEMYENDIKEAGEKQMRRQQALERLRAHLNMPSET